MRRPPFVLPPFRRVLLRLLGHASWILVATAPVAAQHAGELHATFLHTSDEHSAVLPFPLVNHGEPHAPTRGGFARLAAAVEAARADAAARGEPALLTSAGDNIAGTPFAWLVLQGAGTELGLMVELGYDVVTLGNHEFDYDAERLARYIAAAGYPAASARTVLLATNTHAPPGHPLNDLGIRRTWVRELPNGLRVGFLGLIGRGAARFATLAPPVEFTDARAEAAAAVAALRQEGVHVVVAITHSGVSEDRELARSVAGIDIILGGHDHRLIEEPIMEGSTIIVHPGAHTQQLYVLQIGYDPATGRVRVRNGDTRTPHVIGLDDPAIEAPWMAERVAAARMTLEAHVVELSAQRVERLDATVARAGAPLRAGPAMRETPLGNFVTDAMRVVAASATGRRVDLAVQANGVIRGDLVTGVGRRSGDIAFYDLATVIGMGSGPEGSAGYPLVSVWLTGEEVRRVLEISVLLSELLRNSYYLQVSGVRMRYDPQRAILFRIPFRGTPVPTGRAVLQADRLTDDGYVPLQRGDEELYHVVTDYYVASFLPMVGRMLPRLALVPKDSNGRPLDDMRDAVIRRDGRELKVWQAVVEYAQLQPRDADGVARIPATYLAPEGRLVIARSVPLWLPPLLLLAVVAALGTVLWRRGWFRRGMRRSAG